MLQLIGERHWGDWQFQQLFEMLAWAHIVKYDSMAPLIVTCFKHES